MNGASLSLKDVILSPKGEESLTEGILRGVYPEHQILRFAQDDTKKLKEVPFDAGMRPKRGRNGFSLIEVLIALAITSLILSAFLATLRAGVSAFRKMDETSSEIHAARLFLTLLESELRNAIYYSEVPFTGTPAQFIFPALVEEYEEDQITQSPFMITYEYRDRALFRKEASLRGLFTEKKESTQKMISPLKNFVVQYAYRKGDEPEIIWVPSWPSGKGLPRGVQIILTWEGPKSQINRDANDITIRRKFFIPQGTWGLL